MINGDMVVAQTLQGATPPTWRVLHAKASFFYQQIGLSVFLLVLGGAGFIDLINNPNVAYGYGLSDSESLGVINGWRIVDFIIIALVVGGGVFWLVKNIFDMTHAKEQVLVLMPEGFVMHTDKVVAHPYGAMRTMNATTYRGTTTIKVLPANGAKAVTIGLDGRFGNAKQVAQMIMTARNQFAAAQVAAQPPQPPAQYPTPQV